jgi:DNA-binding GntR family transcriptional regulator
LLGGITMTFHDVSKNESQKRSATERAYYELKFKIRENLMVPGTQYLEAELAAMLGMSRTPVREACIRLAEEGVLEIRPRHGVRILPLSPGDMKEIYVILAELESLAAGLLARKGLTESQRDTLDSSLKAMDAAIDEGMLEQWVREDEAFHKQIVKMSENRRLAQVVGMFWDQIHRARMITLKMRPVPRDTNKEHHALVDAIKNSDEKRAKEIHYKSRARAGELIVSLLTKYGINHV